MRFDWSGRGQAGWYERADVMCPALVGDDPAKAPAGDAGDAGDARRAAEKGPDEDRDRWRDFSREDMRRLADDPAAPADAEIAKAGQARDGGRVD